MKRKSVRRCGRTWAPLFLVLGVSAAIPAWGGQADRDADGRADALPARTLAADLDRDGILEFVRYDGRVLTVSRDLDAKGAERIELPEAIRGVGARDVDGDGQLDLAVSLASGRTVRVTRAGRPETGVAQDKATINLTPTWNSGTDLALTWDTALGSFDGDSRADIAATRFGQLYLYENNANNSFQLVYTTPPAPFGAFVSVAGGDTDGDGAPELIGAETSSLPRIHLYERVADNSFVELSIGVAETPSSSSVLIDRVRIADADSDGKREIIFSFNGSTGSRIFVYEHTGTPGANLYTKVYDFTGGGSIVDFAVGDSDNDGWQEIVLALGGGPPFLATLFRLENTGDNTFVAKSVQPGNVGGHHVPVIADLDGDGLNELAFGGVVSTGGGILVYEATANDTYQLVFSQGGLGGSGFSAGLGKLTCSHFPAMAVGSSLGDIGFWRYDGSAYENLLAAPLHLQGGVRSVSVGSADADRGTDLVAGSMGFVPVGDEGVFVFEQTSCP